MTKSPNAELPVNPEWEVHPAQVRDWLAQKEEFLLLDVRRPAEWNASHLESATLLPMNELTARIGEINGWKDRRVVVLCHHGVRSLNVTAFLRQHGFTNIFSMAGGIEAYSVIVDPSIPRY